MRLWTIQSFDIYELMQKEGVYRCNPSKSNLLDTNAYEWISNQMKARIGNPPKGVVFPVWAWYRREGKNNLHYMLRHLGMRVDKKSVLWEIEVPSSEVLLTDFINWHIALNNGINYKANYITSEDEEWEREVDKEEAFYNSLSEEEKKLYKRKSWEQMICTSETSLPNVQATFWELKASQIKGTWILRK